MAKLTLTDITSGYQLASAYNANNTLIEEALENTLSRDGTLPNAMGADLDMNSFQIINLADPILDLDAVNKQYLDAQIAGIEGLSDLSTLDNNASPSADDLFVFEDVSANLPYNITFTQLSAALEPTLNHDNLLGFVANEHINHSSVSINTGTGLTGGGTIASTRTISLSHLGLESLVDPNGDRILFWDDSAGATGWLNFTNGLAITGTSLDVRLLSTGGLAFTGGQIGIDLTGCTADGTIGATDLLLIDDGTAKKVTWTDFVNNIELNINHDSLVGFVGAEHVDHSAVDLTAGAGLTGGGTITVSRSFAVGAGAGISVAADSVALDISGLTALSGSGVAATDGYLVDDGGVMKRISHQAAGIPIINETTTSRTLVDADMNHFLIATNASPITITLNTGVGEPGNILLITQGAAGQVDVSGTATIDNANGTKTASQESVICLFCKTPNVWVLYGDAAV